MPSSDPASLRRGSAGQTALAGVKRFFSRNGLLAQWHPQYEFRPGQLEMAEAVAEALENRKHLIVEAGTGTGKTLAYLVPAILSGRRVVISTGTKNLQEQLFFKDIPFLQQHLGEPLRVAYMKGRNNYLCLHKLEEAVRRPLLDGLEEVADFQIIAAWAKTTETGDRAEIRKLPESSTVWGKLDARAERCHARKCPDFDRCFLKLMHQRAAQADIIIVNHHLFFADLAVRGDDFGAIIPEYAAVIFDEAHELEDVAGQYFGLSVSNYQVEDLVRDCAAEARRRETGSEEWDRILSQVAEASGRFFAAFGTAEGRRGFKHHAHWRQRHAREIQDILSALNLLVAHVKSLDEAEEFLPLARRAETLAGNLEFWLKAESRDFVYWVERRGKGCFLSATPIDISELLAEKLFGAIDTIILTSATLAVAGSFDYIKTRLGAGGARTLMVPGHFDYSRQALLYVPCDMPDPRTPEFERRAAEEILALLEISRGRAFVLFTSHQQMQRVYERVSARTRFPTLLQGSAPRTALLEEFKQTPHCVLFATSSFWQGVDVPGEDLSCVIIDKLPFAAPSDPVVEARIERLRKAGGEPFYDYQLPQAALALKQGFGRLIRSAQDRGVLVLLDSRIVRQRYGAVFFESLPPYRFTDRREEVEKFFYV